MRNSRGDRDDRGDRRNRSDRGDRNDGRERSSRGDRDGFRDNDDRRRQRGNKPMSRIIFNIGKGKDLSKKDVIELLISAAGRKDLGIGQIEIFKRASSVELDKNLTSKVISELNRKTFKGVKIEAEENFEFKGNDFRDRDKGPRGKKKKQNF